MANLTYTTAQVQTILDSVKTRKYGQALTGLQDDANTAYTTAEQFIPGSSELIQNGGILTLDVDYTETIVEGFGVGITVTVPLSADAVLRINYDKK